MWMCLLPLRLRTLQYLPMHPIGLPEKETRVKLEYRSQQIEQGRWLIRVVFRSPVAVGKAPWREGNFWWGCTARFFISHDQSNRSLSNLCQIVSKGYAYSYWKRQVLIKIILEKLKKNLVWSGGIQPYLCVRGLTLFRPGFFRSCGTGGGDIKAMSTKLKGQIVRPKMFPLRSATSGDNVIWRHNNDLFSNGSHLGSAILDFLNFPKTTKIDQEVIKINKLTRKWSQNVKFTSKK